MTTLIVVTIIFGVLWAWRDRAERHERRELLNRIQAPDQVSGVTLEPFAESVTPGDDEKFSELVG